MPIGEIRDEAEAGSPLVTKIVEALTERIVTGRYRDGDGLPAERSLVEEFGVSRTVIRKAIDTLDLQGLVVRAERCRTMVRNPHRTDSLPVGAARRTLGMWLWDGPKHPAASAIRRGVSLEINHEEYRLITGHIGWESWESVRDAEAKFLRQMRSDRDIAGVLLWYLGDQENAHCLEELRAAGVPMVFIDRMPPAGFDGDYVGIANERAAESMVSHLISQGHTRIAHITNKDTASTVKERMDGYVRALQRACLPVRPEYVVTASESNAMEAPRSHGALLMRLMSLPDPPTAVFVVNDVLAGRFLAAVRDSGMRCPEELAIAGFDGLERWSTDSPFLTTVRQPWEEMGSQAVRLLRERIEAQESRRTGAYRHTLLDAPIDVYGSTLKV